MNDMNDTKKKLFNINNDFNSQKEYQKEYFRKERSNVFKTIMKNLIRCGIFALAIVGLISLFL